MRERSIRADYLIMGAGAAGMAFADSVLTESEATLVIVDRRDRPGGHWNDAYPYVRLHQPASFYGVNSSSLGSGAIDQTGLNAGFHGWPPARR
jgi:cation diffusion facilitator CzcD-associated flavoprotein CzcO